MGNMKFPYGVVYSRDDKGGLRATPEEWIEWIDMSKQYNTDLDNDFAPGELLPWQDMSRHLQNLEVFQQEHTERIQIIEKTLFALEKALQTTTDSLQEAHQKIASLEHPTEQEIETEYQRMAGDGRHA
jgi:hypothetical protein